MAQRQMHLITVAEAGTGKSRLLYEFTRWLDGRTPLHLSGKQTGNG
jgi:hypothetical protein